ncbi:MAG: hypothetical protein IKO99_09610 [Bacteroidales bacterium]|nr:hypothetical protein [Bacteroidales bacterium]
MTTTMKLRAEFTDEKIEKNLRQAFGELKDYKDGKIDFQSAEDFLKEWEDK